MVSFDAFEVVPVLSAGTYDDADSAISYIGSWQLLTGTNSYLNTWRYSPSLGGFCPG